MGREQDLSGFNCIRVKLPGDDDKMVIDKVAKEVAKYGHQYEISII